MRKHFEFQVSDLVLIWFLVLEFCYFETFVKPRKNCHSDPPEAEKNLN